MNVIEELASRSSAEGVAALTPLIESAGLAGSRDPVEGGRKAFVAPAAWLLGEVAVVNIPVAESGAVAADFSERMLREFVGADSGIPSAKSIFDQLRASALVTITAGTATRTRMGDSLHERPDDLWEHLARTLPSTRHDISSDGVKLLLLLLASDRFDNGYQEFIAEGLAALGWRLAGAEPLSPFDAFESVLVQYRFLVSSGAIETNVVGDRLMSVASPIGIEFARFALALGASGARG